MTEDVLDEITETSIKNNKKTDITGFLLGMEGKYMQYLEGGQKEVDELYQIIQQDHRHKDLTCWVTGQTENRVFSEWSMACWMLPKEKLEALSALNDLKAFLEDTSQHPMQPKRFISLMNGLLKTWISDQTNT